MVDKEKNLKVLFIDDDKATNFLNKHIAKNNDNISSIVLLDSGFEGISYIKNCLKNEEEKPNIVFLDINMPAMNGWEFLENFYALGKDLVDDINVIILSSSNDPKDLTKFNNYDTLLDFIRKPLDKQVFNSALMKVKNNTSSY
ncbi:MULTISPECIES: response regulator [unclassified Algibacter]|uniref:response regulator n=1 Tax=unclassified Algibacter TaxID=2615009 RepID=UPI00131B71F9|nr:MULTISPECIES: response regulator [unclassified Algibacter]MCL5128571.1 response regulator [Algibacter sp. L4_22]